MNKLLACLLAFALCGAAVAHERGDRPQVHFRGAPQGEVFRSKERAGTHWQGAHPHHWRGHRGDGLPGKHHWHHGHRHWRHHVAHHHHHVHHWYRGKPHPHRHVVVEHRWDDDLYLWLGGLYVLDAVLHPRW
ncbi:MAG: hypothetical protein KatS3mg124_1330 [Porticoccaceae bacterium]|nr:MAG: hypothetical protein KatS3mg124_1330 [Porticoccaceae bacterium]